MAELTSAELLDMRGDLGIGPAPAVFTDAQLQRLYTRAGEHYNTAVYMAWLQIQAGAVGWVDYKVAQTSISREAAYQHIKDMVTSWGAKPGVAANQVQIVGLLEVPPRDKSEPLDSYDGYDNRRPYRRHLGY